MNSRNLIRFAALLFLLLPLAPLALRLDPSLSTDPTSPIWLIASFLLHTLIAVGLLRQRRLAYFSGLVLAVLTLIASLAIWAATALDPDLARTPEYQAASQVAISMLLMDLLVFCLLLHPQARAVFTGSQGGNGAPEG